MRKRKRSRKETIWLDSVGVPNDEAHRQVTVYGASGKRYYADGLVGKVLYEYYGCYFHGCPECHGEATQSGSDNGINAKLRKRYSCLYAKTLLKRYDLILAGYEFVETWECCAS